MKLVDAPIGGLLACFKMELVVVSTLESEVIEISDRCFGLALVSPAVNAAGRAGNGGRVSLDFCAVTLPKLYDRDRESLLAVLSASCVPVRSAPALRTLGTDIDRSSPGRVAGRLLNSGAGRRATDGEAPA